MKYASEQEKQFVDDAIKNGTYRIDYAYRNIYFLSENAYLFDASFCGLDVSSKNSERFIIRALYRKKQKGEEQNQLAEWNREREEHQPMRKGCTRFHFSTFDTYQSKGFVIHFGLGLLHFWRHYPERCEEITVGERGCW